jgi:hypothetical protein
MIKCIQRAEPPPRTIFDIPEEGRWKMFWKFVRAYMQFLTDCVFALAAAARLLALTRQTLRMWWTGTKPPLRSCGTMALRGRRKKRRPKMPRHTTGGPGMSPNDPVPPSGVTVGRVEDNFDSEAEVWTRQLRYLEGAAKHLLTRAKEARERRENYVQEANRYADRAYAYLLLLGKTHEEARKEIQEWRSTVELG